MQYKALFLDLDGTTVKNGLKYLPSKRVQDAIHLAKSKVFVCIATSRPLNLALPVLDHLDIRGLCVVNDGTQIYDPITRKVRETVYLSHEDGEKALLLLIKHKVKIFINDGIDEWEYEGKPLPEKYCTLAVPEITEHQADAIISEVSRISSVTVHKVYSQHKDLFWACITHATATKLHGVVRIAELLGIKIEEMIGVGDGYNDYPLLMACGLKIAMGNAASELKAIADFVAPTVDEDGVATVINKFILS